MSGEVLGDIVGEISAEVARDVGLILARVRVCPGCSRVFLKRYRREFCSAKCQRKLWMRNYRSGLR